MNSISYEQFLSFKRTTEQAIRDAASLLLRSEGNDVILAVGSVAEGLGNSKSDLDLLMIRHRIDASDQAESKECSWIAGDCIVDMQILAVAEVSALVQRLEDWAETPWDVSSAAPFSPEEILLLHRLCNAVPLSVHPDVQRASGLLPELGKVARLKLHRARHMARTVQVDMVGYKRSGDWYSLIYASQDLLGYVADGLLASFKKTNPNPKWRSRLLHDLPADWKRGMIYMQLAADARQALWDVHYAPAIVDVVSAIAHASRSATLGRAIFAHAECKLVHELDEAWEGVLLSTQQPGETRSPFPALELDVDFVISPDGVQVARLNEFGSALQVPFHKFSLILQHDGVTTPEQVMSSAEARTPLPGKDIHLEEFLALVGGSGLLLHHEES
ncbi:hypothetical protein HFO27_33810 [Rhizobium leguminosarum]|uniref:hypothetical protein n=1 Tax=Rhizobium leguminosarum TaxID=384 RepID=UPI001C8FB240|nr:hypothetical protein [Rhizobium leguminosarum]MBY3179497.1 hypothetical protein [Rhizobium leguminosarum]